uniref:Uncharacterized protein n=1 Tax=Tanacetum cinerariifolium TaxID=118510 RepID=A0A6L2P258_TANCI|nr:hypothetical protein [Tanacetum cinerariifolium]
MEILLEPTSNKLLVVGFNSLVHSFRALSALRRSGLRTASTAAKPCQGDSLEFYLITGSINTDQRGTVDDAELEEDADNKVSVASTPPSPTPATTPPPPQQEPIPLPPQAQSAQPSSPPQQQPSQTPGILESLTTLHYQAQAEGQEVREEEKIQIFWFKEVEEVLSMQDTDKAEPAEVEEVLEEKKGYCHKNLEEIAAALVIVHSKVQSKDKVMRYQALKRKPMTEAQERKNMMIYLKNMAGFKMEFFKGMTYSEIRPIFEKYYNSIQAFLKKGKKEIEEEGSKRKIVANDDDDVYIEATPLVSKVCVIDYQIHYENNKPYYKIIRVDGTHKLFLRFITLLKNFDREDLETLWKLVKERFESTEPKNFSNDFLLKILKIMFEKPNVEANMFMLVETKYHLTHFTLEQMLNNVRLEVKKESEMSLELLRLVRRQQDEGYVPE